MESDNEDLPTEDFEFSTDELEEAVKRKPGRPSNRTRELRENIKDAQRLTSILGILDSGLLDQLGERFGGGFGESVREGTDGVNKEDKKPQVAPKGFAADLLKRSGMVNDKFIQTNENFLELFDDVVQKSLVVYGPPITAVVGGLAAIWIAEGKVTFKGKKMVTVKKIVPVFEQIPIREKDPQAGRPALILRFVDGKQIGTKTIEVEEIERIPFPQTLHAIMGVLLNLMKILNAGTKYMEVFGGFDILGDFVTDEGKLDAKSIINFLIFGPIGTALGLGF